MKHQPRQRGGIAMLLVVVVMATAAIMAFALLSSASLQAQAGRNATASMGADGMVQSGTNLALYYLMYPNKADTTTVTTTSSASYYNPGTNIPSMTLADGSRVTRIDVTPVNSTRGVYNVDVTATAGADTATITRASRNKVVVQSRYIPQYAMAANDSFTIPLTFLTSSITGSVRCDGGTGGLLSAIVGLLFGTAENPTPTFPAKACPSYSEINLCKSIGNGTYSYNGSTYTATRLTSATITSANLGNTATAANPGNVYYVDQNATITGTVNFSGTLIVTNSNNLTINSTNVTITAKPGYPALIIGKDLIFTGAGKRLTTNGVTWIGGNWTGTGLLPSGTLQVNGSLMWGGSNPKIDTAKLLGVTSRLVVNYPTSSATLDSAMPDIVYTPELTDKDQTPKNVRVLSRTVLSRAIATATAAGASGSN